VSRFGTPTLAGAERSQAPADASDLAFDHLRGVSSGTSSEPAFGDVLDACPLPILVTDRDGNLRRANRAAVEQLPVAAAVAAGQASGMALQAVLMAELPWGALARRARAGVTAQICVELHDGSQLRRWEVTVRAVADGAALVWHWQPGHGRDESADAYGAAAAPRGAGAAGIAPDVPLLRRAVRRLELVQAAFVATSVPAVILDLRGWPIELNAAFARWSGYGREELFVLGGFEALLDDLDERGLASDGVSAGCDAHPLAPPSFATLAARAPAVARAWLRVRSGATVAVDLTVDPLRDRAGALQAVVVTLQGAAPPAAGEGRDVSGVAERAPQSPASIC
jgi:PAS domain-containing protein